jgi:hypothetical protein
LIAKVLNRNKTASGKTGKQGWRKNGYLTFMGADLAGVILARSWITPDQ